MKSLKTNLDLLKDEINYIKNEMDRIINEHDNISFKSTKEANEWINSIPIESLSDSIYFDFYNKTNKISLSDFKRKKQLFNKFVALQEYGDKILSSLIELQIDNIIKKTKEYQLYV